MMQALNYGRVDYACLGNHEFDMDKKQLQSRLPLYKGRQGFGVAAQETT